ncbi:MAG: EAL domain-containing protein, partial [Pseudomonadota bacterium]
AYAVILSNSDPLPFVLAGYLWVFGIYLHVSNTFGLLPLYNWSQMGVAFATVFVMLWNLSQNPVHDAPAMFWWVTVLMTVVYIVTTSDTMNLQKDTHAALEKARTEANMRLEDLERLSRSDPLTGLMNRRAFDEMVQSMMHQHANRLGVTVFVMDLDGFKPINDSYGHEAGDAVLCKVAERLERLVRATERAARVGGDEFAVLSTAMTSVEMAEEFAKTILDALSEAIPSGEKQLEIGASIGIARQSAEVKTPTDLLSGADQAMYLAKQEPETQIKVYDKGAFPVRATLEDSHVLIEAMETNQIIPHYQPKVDLRTEEIVGFEALSRWHHPTRGILAPSYFLPMINELGLQSAFMLHMAKHVLKDIAQVVEDDLDPGQVSINIPEVTLATLSGRNDLFAVIDTYPQLRSHLTFEITEDIFIARSSDIIRRSIQAFRKAGVRVSLDDFGTGYASLQHLKELEFDELKLDMGFVRDLTIDPAAKVLTAGLVTISKGLDVDLIAEGVETRKQRDMLEDMGCRFAQGFFYGTALPFDEAYLRLAAEQSSRDTLSNVKRKTSRPVAI